MRIGECGLGGDSEGRFQWAREKSPPLVAWGLGVVAVGLGLRVPGTDCSEQQSVARRHGGQDVSGVMDSRAQMPGKRVKGWSWK